MKRKGSFGYRFGDSKDWHLQQLHSVEGVQKWHVRQKSSSKNHIGDLGRGRKTLRRLYIPFWGHIDYVTTPSQAPFLILFPVSFNYWDFPGFLLSCWDHSQGANLEISIKSFIMWLNFCTNYLKTSPLLLCPNLCTIYLMLHSESSAEVKEESYVILSSSQINKYTNYINFNSPRNPQCRPLIFCSVDFDSRLQNSLYSGSGPN